MRVIIANSLKIYNTLLYMKIDALLWNSNSALFSVCDNNKDITHVIAPKEIIDLDYNMQCLKEYKLKFISIDNIINGVNLVGINNMTHMTISGQYILYIDGNNKDQDASALLKQYLDEKCPYNIRLVGPNKIYNYKYLGTVQDDELLNLIKYSNGCIDNFGNNIYDIAYLNKPCSTIIKNNLFTNELKYTAILRHKLPTIEQNIIKALQ